jgi:hypothetical protein
VAGKVERKILWSPPVCISTFLQTGIARAVARINPATLRHPSDRRI